MSSPLLTQLTLAFPPELEARLVEFVLEQEPPLPGFTSIQAHGHGADFSTATTHERVRGRVRRSLIVMVAAAAELERLVAALREAFPNPHVVWWMVPVGGFGRLA
jgi:hypothetical protein